MLRLTALLLTLLTGFTALTYEVAWQRFLAVLLGSHSEATAVVLGLFLGGLSLGYVRFGSVARRIAASAGPEGARGSLLRTYGLVEAGIGVYAIAFPLLFTAARWISLRLPHGPEWVGFCADVLLAALLIGPPAVLMGATIPMLTQALSSGIGDATRFHALVYAGNTAGAFLGALAAGFVLIPRLGLTGVMLAGGTLNVLAGVVFLAMARSRGVARAAEDEPRVETRARAGAYLGAAVLAGFGMMALQATFNRIGALAVGASPFTFAMVVATFVACIALGSFVVAGLRRIHRAVLPVSQWALVALLILLFPKIAEAPYWAHVLRAAFRDDPHLAYPYHLTTFVGLVAVLALPLALSGATLPLIFDRLRSESGRLGDVAGRIYGWNTTGSLLGALIGGYALLFFVDLHVVYRLAVLALAGAAALVTPRNLGRGGLVAGTALAATVLTLVFLPAWPAERMTSGTFRIRTPTETTFAGADAFFEDYLSVFSDDWILSYEDDPTVTVAVITMEDGGRAVLVNGKSDSSTVGDRITTGLIGLLPAMLARECERAFVVGFGTGVTAGELAALDTVREVVVAEISPGVIRAAPLFEELNQGAAGNPKTRIVRSDAYRALLRSRGTFDVIASEPSNPWVEGVEMLYSLEFLEAARAKLSPGGVYLQWIQTYETDDRTLRLALDTFRTAFPRVSVWMPQRDDLLLVGFTDPAADTDLQQLVAAWSRADVRAGLQRSGIRSFPGLLTHEVLPSGVLGGLGPAGEVHRLLRPRLNHLAALAFFAGGRAELPSTVARASADAGAASSLLRRYRLARGGRLPDEDWVGIVEAGCRLSLPWCAALFARWYHELPGSTIFEANRSAAQRAAGGVAELSVQNVSRLALLFRADGAAGAAPNHRVASLVLDSFTRFYHHAVPFHPGPLQDVWLRCGEPACTTEHERIRNTGVGPALLAGL